MAKKSKKKSGKGGPVKAFGVIVLCLAVVYLLSSQGGNMLAPSSEPSVNVKIKEEAPKAAAAAKKTATETPKPSSNKKNSKRYEVPATAKGDKLIEHTGFVLSYNYDTNNPNWVAWDLTADEVNTKVVERSNEFKGDPLIAEKNRVETYHYKKTGFDRGHMCPAADMKWNAQAMQDCFYMTNICPQVPVLNQRWWEHLEEGCRRWAKQEGTIYICCGPIYNANLKEQTIGDKKIRVRVPDAFFKVVLSLKEGEEKAIGFLYANSDKRQTMEDAAVSVDSVETVTGYDFFPELSNKLEKRLEAQCNLKVWN